MSMPPAHYSAYAVGVHLMVSMSEPQTSEVTP